MPSSLLSFSFSLSSPVQFIAFTCVICWTISTVHIIYVIDLHSWQDSSNKIFNRDYVMSLKFKELKICIYNTES